ncbi:MAG TPA: prolipoprotein diacylglyceryl transferase [Flavobacteriaceae bacterium]|nr:prolipoprotein diacylglyceryl transferase [Flavobacteriaceae bacterium]HPF11341.1 prolipoprotein diacylglyceryl transferase [Flavobacteriaceae bacterium]HQU20504.1 prolipoprotein diacylglyceryl transferase [Flavobacteriaceae bacterium]HQU65863.1 prolipoprotein diacylglyceryl transferase [Flavobacteriaceae bacterium]HRW44161.1 prolipoprotein diacylglyceryl transferase [Flavobacteriaceae bacterium]
MYYLSFTWNPSEGIDLGFYTIQYYSLMFVIAFLVGWFIMKSIYKREGETMQKLDSLFIYMVLAILIGARLGHVIFYQPELFKEDFFSVFLPFSFKGGIHFTGFRGLASHGAAIGIIIAMFLYNKKILKKPILWIFDRVIIPVAIGGVFVRFGNFMNSEIVGKPTGTDYGVIFANNNETFPRHPAQLYEAAGYIIVFLILWYVYWKTDKRKYLGYIFGLFLILLWMVRFIAEFFKKSQEGFADGGNALLSTGQWLSIPFIILGIYLLVTASKRKIE